MIGTLQVWSVTGRFSLAAAAAHCQLTLPLWSTSASANIASNCSLSSSTLICRHSVISSAFSIEPLMSTSVNNWVRVLSRIGGNVTNAIERVLHHPEGLSDVWDLQSTPVAICASGCGESTLSWRSPNSVSGLPVWAVRLRKYLKTNLLAYFPNSF